MVPNEIIFSRKSDAQKDALGQKMQEMYKDLFNSELSKKFKTLCSEGTAKELNLFLKFKDLIKFHIDNNYIKGVLYNTITEQQQADYEQMKIDENILEEEQKTKMQHLISELHNTAKNKYGKEAADLMKEQIFSEKEFASEDDDNAYQMSILTANVGEKHAKILKQLSDDFLIGLQKSSYLENKDKIAQFKTFKPE